MKRRITYRIASIIALLTFFNSCEVNKPVAKQATPLKVPSYSFLPPSTSAVGSAKISFLFIQPKYAPTFEYSSVKVFYEFSKSMSADINQALTARGYTVRGPYDTYDEVVYSDRKETDLLLQIDISPEVDLSNVQCHRHVYMYGNVQQFYYTYEGTLILSGKVNLTASETMTREKLWAKSIPLEQKSIEIATEHKYASTHEFVKAMTNDAGVVNPVVDVMQDFYKTVLQTAWNHLDPQELNALKTQVDEIRAKSNINQH